MPVTQPLFYLRSRGPGRDCGASININPETRGSCCRVKWTTARGGPIGCSPDWPSVTAGRRRKTTVASWYGRADACAVPRRKEASDAQQRPRPIHRTTNIYSRSYGPDPSQRVRRSVTSISFHRTFFWPQVEGNYCTLPKMHADIVRRPLGVVPRLPRYNRTSPFAEGRGVPSCLFAERPLRLRQEL